MRLPLRYSIRNILRRKVRTLLTVLAIAMVVSITVVLFSFAKGLMTKARSSGSPDNLIVMDRNAATQTFSKISIEDYNLLKSLPQIKRGPNNEPMVAPEALHQTRIDVGERKQCPGTVRGVTKEVFEVNGLLKLEDGEMPESGRRVVVGALTHTALGVPKSSLAIGKTLKFQNEEWEIVGHFSAGGTALDSEILANLNDIMAIFARANYSSVLVKLKSARDAKVMITALNQRNDVQVKAVGEQEYYRSLAEGFDRIIFLAVAMAVIAMIGGLVSGLNTMYASVLGRIREIGTLKTLGYRPSDIIQSFVMESVSIALIGAAIGCAVSMLANNTSTKFTAGAFMITIDAWAMGAGVAVAVLIGILGGLIPAWKGSKMHIPAALSAL